MRPDRLLGGALLVTLLLTSGCASRNGERPQTAPVEAPRSAVEQEINAFPLHGAREDAGGWWVLSAQATPRGALSAFRWNPPAGAVVQLPGSKGVLLEVAPVVVNGTGPESWCLIGFAQEEAGGLRWLPHLAPMITNGGWIPLTYALQTAPLHCEGPTTKANRTLAQAASPPISTTSVANHKPFLIQLNLDFADLTSTYWVLAAQHPSPIDFGIAFRPILAGSLNQNPAPDTDAFVAAREGGQPYVVKVRATGTGFHYARYQGLTQSRFDASELLVHRETRVGSMRIVERMNQDARPVGSARNLTYESEYERGGGWSATWGSFFSYCAAGKWETTASTGSTPEHARGVLWQVTACGGFFGAFGMLVFGSPQFLFIGEGPGDVRSSFGLQYASATFEETEFGHIAFGASLSDLFGINSKTTRLVGTVLGNFPP